MPANCFDRFDQIRIINLPERKDRRRQMEAELRRIGMGDDPRVAFVQAVRPPDMAPFRAIGEKGVFLSQLKVLKAAAEAKASVLILEDDVDFTAAAADGRTLPADGLTYGGYEASDPANLPDSDIIGAHCMGISAEQAALLVPYLEKLLDHASPPPIDGAYVWYRREFRDVPTHFAIPPVAVQRPSRSDIASLRLFDRMPITRELAGFARRIKRRLT